VTIDSISLHTIDRSTLRRRIIAVPQDAVFLPDGTSVQANLDPFGASSAAECRDVLEAVGLRGLVGDVDGEGLAAGLAADTLSQGQKQLFSLARAVLRRRIRARELRHGGGLGTAWGQSSDEAAQNEKGTGMAEPHSAGSWTGTAPLEQEEGGILLLDEVSSSVDLETERAMQAVIKREFEGYTIVMISHRLEMVMDFDRVIVMDTGSVVESGKPTELVEVEGSRFRDLWMVGRRE
jgi:ABC-type multidrug transport system fused ATPase/permease subunit